MYVYVEYNCGIISDQRSVMSPFDIQDEHLHRPGSWILIYDEGTYFGH